MTVLEEDKKSLKKWLARKRNRREFLIFQQLMQVREGQERILEEEEEKRLARRSSSDHKKEPDEVWSAKTQEIRNRLNGKKRDAKERWNRFSGTEDSGGRGL